MQSVSAVTAITHINGNPNALKQAPVVDVGMLIRKAVPHAAVTRAAVQTLTDQALVLLRMRFLPQMTTMEGHAIHQTSGANNNRSIGNGIHPSSIALNSFQSQRRASAARFGLRLHALVRCFPFLQDAF